MRVVLIHHHVVFIGIVFGSLIAHDDSRRNTCRPHQECKTAGIVFTKPLAGIEQKIIDALLIKECGIQGVEKGILLEVRQDRIDKITV